MNIVAAPTESIAKRRRTWLSAARTCAVTGTHPPGGSLEQIVRAQLKAAAVIIQLQDESASEIELVRSGRIIRRLCDAYDALFIVSGLPDLALACGADGVDVTDNGPSDTVRRMVGSDMLIGREVVDIAQLAEIGDEPAVDFYMVRPERLDLAEATVDRPVVEINSIGEGVA